MIIRYANIYLMLIKLLSENCRDVCLDFESLIDGA
jgi:hypothetical protein